VGEESAMTNATLWILETVPWGEVVVAAGTVAVVAGAFFAAGAAPAWATRAVLRALRAQPLSGLEAAAWRETSQRLANARGIETPTLWVVPHPQANVFALSGARGGPLLSITEGALTRLGKPEIEAALGAALARASRPDLARATLAAGVGLVASALAGLGMVEGAQAEDDPVGWPVGVPFLIVGGLLSRGLGRSVPGPEADLEGALLSGRFQVAARLLEHLEVTAYHAPMGVSAALSRLALVDPRGERKPFTLRWIFPAPPPSAPRAALLRSGEKAPGSPDHAQAA
jgi:Zn-dependent protease with chaperone function